MHTKLAIGALAISIVFFGASSGLFAASKVQPCWDSCARERVSCVSQCGPVCGTLSIQQCAKKNPCVGACWSAETACHKKCVPGRNK